MSYALAVPSFQRLNRTNHIMPAHRIHWKHRVLYVGRDHVLTSFLKDTLKPLDCFVVRCPGGRESYCLIESDIKYSLLLFDEELPDMTGAELEHFALTLSHREQTPIIVFKKSDDFNKLVETIIHLLATLFDRK